MSQPIYIHFGSSKYDPNHFVTPRNSDGKCIYNKPLGGLWASRIDSDYGWKNGVKIMNFVPIICHQHLNLNCVMMHRY